MMQVATTREIQLRQIREDDKANVEQRHTRPLFRGISNARRL
jgi:hypothetical protein